MRKVWFLTFCLAGCSSSQMVIHPELANEFYVRTCNSRTFAASWMQYEENHWDFYGKLYYQTTPRAQQRLELARFYSRRRDEVCRNVEKFLTMAPTTIEKMKADIESLTGETPSDPVYFAVALQETDGRSDKWNGDEVVVLNARHQNLARPSGLLTTITHELLHSTQGTRGKDLPPFLRSLYREGAAEYGVQTLLPGVDTRGDLPQAEKAAPRAAKEVLQYLDNEPSVDIRRKFFEGGYKDSELPPRMGYYLGALIFQHAAETRGKKDAFRMSPKEFLKEAKSYLTELAK